MKAHINTKCPEFDFVFTIKNGYLTTSIENIKHTNKETVYREILEFSLWELVRINILETDTTEDANSEIEHIANSFMVQTLLGRGKSMKVCGDDVDFAFALIKTQNGMCIDYDYNRTGRVFSDTVFLHTLVNNSLITGISQTIIDPSYKKYKKDIEIITELNETLWKLVALTYHRLGFNEIQIIKAFENDFSFSNFTDDDYYKAARTHLNEFDYGFKEDEK